MPTVGLALIAKNEEERLPNLLASVEGAFDQVVLVDTGSRDRTVRVFREWAKRQEGVDCIVERFKWRKDFGAARTFAQSLLTTDWECWADCDDVINGAQNLRQVAAQAPEEVAGLVAGYNYAQHPQTGSCICYLRRERLVRRGKAKWMNRVHEAQIVEGPVQMLEPNVCEWIHRKQASSMEQLLKEDSRRNLDILESWYQDEPTNTRVLAYLGTENLAQGDTDAAVRFFYEYLGQNPDWDEERAQIHRKLSTALLMRNELDAAMGSAFEALKVMPQWTDTYITLAEVCHLRQEHAKCVEWAREALRRGKPDTMLIINPLDYEFTPRKVMAGSLAALQQWDEAIKVGTEAWQLNPGDQALVAALSEWRMSAKREHTANSFCMMTQQLIHHDEQLKALTLITECVPHFINEHPKVVALRTFLKERIEWIHNPAALLEHYENGGSKPEDFLPEDQLDEVPARLPRTMFLYQGIHEQLLEAHQDGLIQEAIEEQLPAFIEAATSD